jgi:hypothetical protein
MTRQSDHHSDEAVDLRAITSNLASSLETFTKSTSTAIKRLYAGPRRAKGIYHDSSDSSDEGSDQEEHGQGPNETVFLIYL